MKLRRMLSLLMAACVGFAAVPVTHEIVDENAVVTFAATKDVSGTCGDNVTWKLDEESGLLTISGTGEMMFENNSRSPFNGDKRITKVMIENGITKIPDSTFANCKNLTEAIIPDSVTRIEPRAFFSCNALTSVALPDGITEIGEVMFGNCTSLKELTIPDTVKTIGNGAFSYCESLTELKIPANVTSIVEGTFIGCRNLTSIHVAGSNPSYCDLDGVLYNKDLTSILCCPEAREGSYEIPNSVKTIGDFAFACCKRLDSITIPEQVTSIGYRSFEFCKGLTYIEIPESVESIGKEAFMMCWDLASVVIKNPDCVIYDAASTFSDEFWTLRSIDDYFYGTIYGYENSTAQAYAEKYNYKFRSFRESDPAAFDACFPTPYKIIALRSNENGKYLTCDVGAQQNDGKYNMNYSEIKAEADQIQAYEEFELVPCSDGHYAIRSRFNRKYLSYHSFPSPDGLKFKADFIRDDELLELETDGTGCRIRFVNEDKYLCVTEDNKVDVTDSTIGTWFQLETVLDNPYSAKDKAALASTEWLNIDNKGVGYWNIQNEIGKDKSDALSSANTSALQTLGYSMLSRNDKNAATIEYDNMQCAVGAKKLVDGTYDVIIVFQGTRGYKDEDLNDWFRDDTSNLTFWVNGRGMHTGYYEMAMKLGRHESSIVVNPLFQNDDSMEDNLSLSDLLSMAKDGKAHINLLGHSMGGAIAQCYALHLVDDLGISKDNITGRTFNPALAVTEDDAGWNDWINLCVSSDTVPNGLVPGSIYEYGLHRLGRTIWLYDSIPDLNIDALPIVNIAEAKHNMDQTMYNTLHDITEKYDAYANDFKKQLSKEQNAAKSTRVITFDYESKGNAKLALYLYDENNYLFHASNGSVDRNSEYVWFTEEDGKVTVEGIAKKVYTIKITPDIDREFKIGIATNNPDRGMSNTTEYSFPGYSGTYTIYIPAYEDSVNVTDENGNTIEPVKTWLLGDVNGNGPINASDASQVLIAAAAVGAGNGSGLTSVQQSVADVNHDGTVNASDAAVVLIYAAAIGAGQDVKLTDFVH